MNWAWQVSRKNLGERPSSSTTEIELKLDGKHILASEL